MMNDSRYQERPLDIVERLQEWAGWKRCVFTPPSMAEITIEYKLMREGTVGAGSRTAKPSGGGITESLATNRDWEYSYDQRCREIEHVVRDLPEDWRVVLAVTYITPDGEVRSERYASSLMDIGRDAYRLRRAHIEGWLAGKLGVELPRQRRDRKAA